MDPNSPPEQLNSPIVGLLIRWGSRVNTKLYQLTSGRVGSSWRIGAALHKPAPVCLLTTTGRKSGEKRTVPLLFMRDGDNVVVVASQGGMARNPAWYLNLVADPEVVVQIGSTTTDMVAHTAADAERAELWSRLVEVYSDFDTYAAWTDRTIPVVVCTPLAKAA